VLYLRSLLQMGYLDPQLLRRLHHLHLDRTHSLIFLHPHLHRQRRLYWFQKWTKLFLRHQRHTQNPNQQLQRQKLPHHHHSDKEKMLDYYLHYYLETGKLMAYFLTRRNPKNRFQQPLLQNRR
jgi:hypothetical protein